MTTAPVLPGAPAHDVIRVATWNLKHNGIDRNGNDTRWHLAMQVLADLKPHLLLRQELTQGHMHGARAVWAEAARLGGFIPFVSQATSESANPTGVYIDPHMFDVVEYYEHVTGMWHAVCNPVVRLKRTTTNLSIASFHLCSFDPQQRASEAKRLTTLGKPGMHSIGGGDTNSFGHRPIEAASLPDWATIDDRSYVEHRTTERDGRLVADTRPDAILSGEHGGQPPVFRELGYYAATELRQRGASPLAPTASLWRTDQGPMRRIDRIYATPQIASALLRLDVINNEYVGEASDHAIVVADFSRTKLHQALGGEHSLAS
ncbi:endonuclease/exonuclease/phosphatase family protein [Streptomyces sp. PmtG]